MKHVANQVSNNEKTTSLPNPYNIGTIDRVIRYIIGAGLVGSVFYLNPNFALSLAGLEIKLYKLLPLIGIYPAVTAWLGWDPLYQVMRIKSSSHWRGDVCGSLTTQTKTLAKQQ